MSLPLASLAVTASIASICGSFKDYPPAAIAFAPSVARMTDACAIVALFARRLLMRRLVVAFVNRDAVDMACV